MQVDELLLDVTQMDEITFWSRQLAEHALFISKALEAGREELTTLGLENLITDGIAFYELWMFIFDRLRMGEEVFQEELLDSLEMLRNYLIRVGELVIVTWVGYNFPSQIEHYLEELKHMERHVKGEEIPEEELVAFWTEIHKDHAALFSRLLDPAEKDAFQETLLYQQLFETTLADLPTQEIEIDQYVTLSQQINDFNNFTATLREQQALGQLRSVIHPRLALHIHREGLRSIVELKL